MRYVVSFSQLEKFYEAFKSSNNDPTQMKYERGIHSNEKEKNKCCLHCMFDGNELNLEPNLLVITERITYRQLE